MDTNYPFGPVNFSTVDVLMWLMFEEPRWMSLTRFVGNHYTKLSLMSIFHSFVQSLTFWQEYYQRTVSYKNILCCIWKLTLSATTLYKNNCNTINGLWDIGAERSAIALIIYFSRNIAKTIYRIMTFLDSFESWSHQLQHIKKLLLYS